MTEAQAPILRRAGAACLTGAALTIAGSGVMGVATATSDVSDDLYRSPLSHDAFVGFAVYAALLHLVILAGIAGFRRSDIAGGGRVARLGLAMALAGTALLFVCEWSTIPLVDDRTSATPASLVDAAFGVATILATVGMIAAGRATLAAGRVGTWRRYAPLACGLLSLIVIPVEFTSALWLGVGIYGLGYGVLGTALVTDPRAAYAPALQSDQG